MRTFHQIKPNAVMITAFFAILLVVGCNSEPTMLPQQVAQDRRVSKVCPPFFLRDEHGNVIDPVKGINGNVPYSPKQTCGAPGCHDYGKITEGYHFQQGADERASELLRSRYQWVSTPGNYGGTWCSPAPLYSYLSPKQNTDPSMMDMTSFTFITRGCGNCHPGGGPVEFDRDGKRYDVWMADPASGFTSGGENNLDGDYHKARWSESGVLEADCMLCHQPSYNFGIRNSQLADFNFRWAPTAASGLGVVEGSVAGNRHVSVKYDKSKFNPDGRISPHIVVSPRNETCLACHAQPGWKKRGADYRARTDVHLRAGMRCVDCHAAGSRAADERIRGKEIHQFGKGDDPGGRVRDDLDNTVRDCASCHLTGELGAPVARHDGLPPIHLERIACQTCHTPEKFVMPIQVQASDVFNPDALIQPGGKQLWTFYGVDGTYRNHYGILHMMGYDDKPTERFRPVLARYKGKIYPVNRVHSSWIGIETPGQTGLMQPRMSDIRAMWKAHNDDPARHPELATITDDNGDGIIEVNRPEEIDALITAVGNHLTAIGYPLSGKHLVWVSDNRVYHSGHEYIELNAEPWEASVYANVHKYNHDIQPARAALGANGCSDCHSNKSHFFSAGILARQFDSVTALPVWVPNHEVLNISSFDVAMGAFREGVVKPSVPWVFGLLVLTFLLHAVIYGRHTTQKYGDGEPSVTRFSTTQRVVHFVVLSSFIVVAISGTFFFLRYALFNGEEARTLHTWAGIVFSAGWLGVVLLWFRDMMFARYDKLWFKALGGYFGQRGRIEAGKFSAGQKAFFWIAAGCGLVLVVTGIALALLGGTIETSLSVLYTLHNIAALLLLVLLAGHIYLGVVANPHSLRSIFGGMVSREWMKEHHPRAADTQR